MKTRNLFRVHVKKSILLALLISPLLLLAQIHVRDFSEENILWEPFWPWDSEVLTNDSLRVDISSDFSADQKKAIKDGIDRWNAEGCKPPLKVDGADAPVKVVKGDLPAGTQGTTNQTDSDNDGKAESAVITIDPDECTGISVGEVATHELGHALGLGHTDGADDVMKPKGTNGTDGKLSDHDKAELETVDDQYAVLLPRDGAESPLMAIIPGVISLLQFDLLAYYPPEILPQVQPFIVPYFDENLVVVHSEIGGQILNVEVQPSPEHWSGTFYLMIHLLPPAPFEPKIFLGYFYINQEPVPPVAFECPFEIYEENGSVMVNWSEFCNYPFGNDLNSILVVDGNAKYSPKNGDNFVVNLDPGTHIFDLYVDDFQVNSAISSQVFLVTGNEYIGKAPFFMDVSPNPFSESCKISSDRELIINIFDATGRQVESLTGKAIVWTPAAGMNKGIYYIHATDGKSVMVSKALYLK